MTRKSNWTKNKLPFSHTIPELNSLLREFSLSGRWADDGDVGLFGQVLNWIVSHTLQCGVHAPVRGWREMMNNKMIKILSPPTSFIITFTHDTPKHTLKSHPHTLTHTHTPPFRLIIHAAGNLLWVACLRAIEDQPRVTWEGRMKRDNLDVCVSECMALWVCVSVKWSWGHVGSPADMSPVRAFLSSCSLIALFTSWLWCSCGVR